MDLIDGSSWYLEKRPGCIISNDQYDDLDIQLITMTAIFFISMWTDFY